MRRSPDSIIVATGDFNTNPDSLHYKLFIECADDFRLIDVHRDEYITTYGSPSNSWFPTRVKEEKLDYIFYDEKNLNLLSKKLVFDEPIEGMFLSDHFGIEATFKIDDSKLLKPVNKRSSHERAMLLERAYLLYNNELTNLDRSKTKRIAYFVFALILYAVCIVLGICFQKHSFAMVFHLLQGPVLLFAIFNAALYAIFINDEYRALRHYFKSLKLRKQ